MQDNNDLWADPCTRYCDESGVEYAHGTPRDLALQIKQKDATIFKLRSDAERAMMISIYAKRVVEAIDKSERMYRALCEGVRLHFHKTEMKSLDEDLALLRALVCENEIPPNYPLDTQE